MSKKNALSNSISDYDSVSFLFLCPGLENLVLAGNPVSADPDYRPTVFRILPRLKNLDVVVTARADRAQCRRGSRKWSRDGGGGDDDDEAPAAAMAENKVEEVERKNGK